MDFGDVFGFIIFLVFAAISFAGKAAKKQQKKGEWGGGGQEQPKWPSPGPVAQPPTPSPSTPRPSWPPLPPTPTSAAPAPKAEPRRSWGGEGVSMEAGRTSTQGRASEGPSPGRTLAEERERFNRVTQENRQRMTTGLHRTEAAVISGDGEGVALNLQGALSNPNEAARAIVLAEVLGKPKALRGPHRR